ncbi:hypothetical protein GCM10010252_22920 [Streptomyces aureoverticillatus]|nr:hypothetical protein GCM10010252_22920 [Streptomyces aureoverticillatus]
MRVKILGSALAAVFSAAVALGALGGLSADTGEYTQSVRQPDTGWTNVQTAEADTGWTSAPKGGAA